MTPAEIIAAAREIVNASTPCATHSYSHQHAVAERHALTVARELLRLHDGAEALRAELELWKPMTDEEATAALNAAEAVPMSDERLKEIVAFAIDPANKLPNNEQAQLAADNKRLRAENERLKNLIESYGNNPAGFDWGVLGEIDQLETERDRLAAELTEARAEVDRLNKMRVHCPDCGGDYLQTGVETGCACKLKAELAAVRQSIDSAHDWLTEAVGDYCKPTADEPIEMVAEKLRLRCESAVKRMTDAERADVSIYTVEKLP